MFKTLGPGPAYRDIYQFKHRNSRSESTRRICKEEKEANKERTKMQFYILFVLTWQFNELHTYKIKLQPDQVRINKNSTAFNQ